MQLPMLRGSATAVYAWWRYRRILRWLMAATVALMLGALRLANAHASQAAVRRYVIAALVVGLAMLISSLWLGLVLLFRKAPADENPQPAPPRSDALE